MTAMAPFFERPPGSVVDEDVLARLLLRYGLGPSEQAAIRAFGRIVTADELAAILLERLHLGEGNAADVTIAPILRDFCMELVQIVNWDFSPAWPAALAARSRSASASKPVTVASSSSTSRAMPTLAVTWSPQYCRDHGDGRDARFQCGSANRFGNTRC